MSKPIIISNGSQEIKIYTVVNRGRQVFQISFYEAGKRERKTCGDMAQARREAKAILGRLALTSREVDELSLADMESYAVARKHIQPTGMPLHECAETFAKAHAVLAGTPLMDAVRFYRQYHPLGVEIPSMEKLKDAFVASRKKMEVNKQYVAQIKRRFKQLIEYFPQKRLADFRTTDLDDWLSSRPWEAITKNSTRKVLISFGHWAQNNGYLPTDRSPEFNGMLTYKERATKVAIYSPKELADLLALVQARRPALLPWLACAAFTGVRKSELAKLRWEHINFERSFVEVASEKVRTKARRLVPLHDALRAWLLPCRQESGPIMVYSAPEFTLRHLVKQVGLVLKKNGFRHSYISYRIAQLNDTARVALEAGNSPDIIFQHYRELVSPEDAKAWFGSLPQPRKQAVLPMAKMRGRKVLPLPLAA